MPQSMSQASLPIFEINLNALSGVLDKAAAFAAAKKIDPTELLHSRLSPDMFDLTRQVQVAKTVAYLKTLDRAKIDASAEREITFPLGPDKKGHMKGDDYLNHFMLPNFYFHCTAAYAILRHLGVDIGKRDFLGEIPLKMT
jgi:uncharacterized protein